MNSLMIMVVIFAFGLVISASVALGVMQEREHHKTRMKTGLASKPSLKVRYIKDSQAA